MLGCMGKSKESHDIEEAIKQEREVLHKQVKLLLLGTGDAGKSTFTKQLKVHYGDGFTCEEVKSYKAIISVRIMVCIHNIIKACKQFKIKTKFRPHFEELLKSSQLTPDLVPLIQKMWEDKGIKQTFARSDEFQLDSNFEYYVTHLERFADPNEMLSSDDIIKVRQKTSGITETKFKFDGFEFTLVDVGGQRSERRKWLNCFEGVTALLYFVSLSEYNQTLSEDYRVNRLRESLELFEEVSGSQTFAETNFFMFFNKHDLFEKKISKYPLSELFDDYKGDDTLEDSVEFIMSQFKNRYHGSEDHYHVFITCSLDWNELDEAIAKIREIMKKQDEKL